MNNGWIKLHRKMTEWEWYQDHNTFHVFLHLLLTANHEEKKWQGVTVLPGQKITSYQHLAQGTGLSVRSVRTAINKLKSTGEVTCTGTNRYSLITILNWSEHQQTTSNTAHSRQTNDKQTTTNKNVKKDKNEKNTQPPETDGGVVNQVIELFKEVNPAYSLCFKRKQQREAAHNLFKAHGIERLTNILGYLKANAANRYIPTITTPCQLEEKWAALETFARRQKAEATSKRTVII